MEIKLTPEESDLISRAIDTGRLKRPEDAVHQALELWIERERRRDEILAAIDEADESLARGEGIVITRESMRQLAEDVKRRGRERLATERKKARR
jgi:Arc/MetJ-type ribon-helix-helix transcriptional regulator